MEFISVFDVIGPNMIGPSSSHTAGACAIAKMAVVLFGKPIVRAEFTLYGSFAKTYKGHGTDRALLGGVLGYDPDDRRIKTAFERAKNRGVSYEFKIDNETKVDHPNTADVKLFSFNGQSMTVRGESIGGGKIRICRIDNMDVDFTGEYCTLVVRQMDKPGVLEIITSQLSKYAVNIAFLKLHREEKGGIAYTVIGSDQDIPKGIVRELEKHDNILNALLIPARR